MEAPAPPVQTPAERLQSWQRTQFVSGTLDIRRSSPSYNKERAVWVTDEVHILEALDFIPLASARKHLSGENKHKNGLQFSGVLNEEYKAYKRGVRKSGSSEQPQIAVAANVLLKPTVNLLTRDKVVRWAKARNAARNGSQEWAEPVMPAEVAQYLQQYGVDPTQSVSQSTAPTGPTVRITEVTSGHRAGLLYHGPPVHALQLGRHEDRTVIIGSPPDSLQKIWSKLFLYPGALTGALTGSAEAILKVQAEQGLTIQLSTGFGSFSSITGDTAGCPDPVDHYRRQFLRLKGNHAIRYRLEEGNTITLLWCYDVETGQKTHYLGEQVEFAVGQLLDEDDDRVDVAAAVPHGLRLTHTFYDFEEGTEEKNDILQNIVRRESRPGSVNLKQHLQGSECTLRFDTKEEGLTIGLVEYAYVMEALQQAALQANAVLLGYHQPLVQEAMQVDDQPAALEAVVAQPEPAQPPGAMQVDGQPEPAQPPGAIFVPDQGQPLCVICFEPEDADREMVGNVYGCSCIGQHYHWGCLFDMIKTDQCWKTKCPTCNQSVRMLLAHRRRFNQESSESDSVSPPDSVSPAVSEPVTPERRAELVQRLGQWDCATIDTLRELSCSLYRAGLPLLYLEIVQMMDIHSCMQEGAAQEATDELEDMVAWMGQYNSLMGVSELMQHVSSAVQRLQALSATLWSAIRKGFQTYAIAYHSGGAAAAEQAIDDSITYVEGNSSELLEILHACCLIDEEDCLRHGQMENEFGGHPQWQFDVAAWHTVMQTPAVYAAATKWDELKTLQHTIRCIFDFNIAQHYYDGNDHFVTAEDEGEEFKVLINTHLDDEDDFMDFTELLFEASPEVADP